jgi:cell division septum initiation protein DivIVA
VRAKNDVKAKIEDLRQTHKELTGAIDKLKSEIAENQKQLKRAGKDRASENKEFQMTIADQRATQKLLTAAINILKGFYAKKAALLQASQPAGFEAYKKNAAAGGVMGMIQQIINDAKAMETEAIRSEEDATKAYEAFVKETNGTVQAKGKDIVNKSQNKAKAEADLVEAKEDKAGVVLDLQQLRNGNAELHQSCDFVMKNFEIRQTARDEEVDALKQAKAILSGAKFNAFLQSA